MMTATVTETQPSEQVTGRDYVEGIRALIESGEIASVPGWGDGKFFLGDGKGNWHYEKFVAMFRAWHEAMRAVNPTLPEPLPAHCMDPKFISDIFGIPLDKLNAPVAIKPRRTEPPRKPSIPSPYLDAQQAADYLGMTVKALYGHVDRRKLRPLPGYKKYRFTKEQLDAFLRGEKPK